MIKTKNTKVNNSKPEYQTAWDLTLLYKGTNDHQIEADMQNIEKAYDAFEKKYKNEQGRPENSYLENADALLSALTEYENIFDKLCIAKPYLYFAYRTDLNSGDKEAEAKQSMLLERFTKNDNKLIFFTIKLGKIPENKQKEFLSNPKLAKYKHYLAELFKTGKHMLTEAEEKVLNLKNQPSRSLWIQGVEKATSKLSVPWKKDNGKNNKKQNIPLAEAVSLISSLKAPARYELQDLVNQALKSVSPFAESEVNAVVIDKKIEDELRGFPKPYSATVSSYQNKEETVENLIKTVTDGFKVAHRFYEIKAKILKLKNLKYADRAIPIGRINREFSFDESVKITESAFGKVNKIYSDILIKYLKNGQVDVFPKIGKHGGAYCSSSNNMPTFVLLNHTSRYRDVSTLAHEMGHAIHARLSADNQPAIYKDHTISTAEVASTLFENFVFDEIFEKLSKKEQIIALHDKINDSVNTIFRQIACFNFELELHNTIRASGFMQKEEISALMNKHMSSYLGPKFKLTEDDGYFFVGWSHIRNFFYVYSYAFGAIVSRALYSSYKKDPNFELSIRKFLSAGGSKTPEEIFKDSGIDVTKPEFFKLGINEIEKDIEHLENLLKQR